MPQTPTAQFTLTTVFEASGLSKNEFARRLQADRSQVRRWLRGENVPGRFWRREIARVLGVKASSIDWKDA